MSKLLLDYIKEKKQDAVIYKASDLIEQAGDDVFAKSLVLEPIGEMLACLNSEMLLEHYTKAVSKLLDVNVKTIIALVKKDVDSKKKEEEAQIVKEGNRALPKWINKDIINTWGFDQRHEAPSRDDIGVYFLGSNNSSTQLTNFTIKPLIHVYSKDTNTNRRLTEIQSGYKKSVIELPNKAWLSPAAFEGTLLDEGSFMMYDGFTQSNLNKLKRVIIPQYVRGYQLGKLGWQNKEGFFAFSNLIFHKDQIIKFDEYGIAEIDGVKYLSMGSSNALADLREDEDEYKNQKFLTYVEGNISFNEWSKYMMDAYLERGMIGVAFAIMAAFKDIVFKRNRNQPIPFLYGEAESGKTKFGESIVAIFTHNMPALNLNQTTIFGLWDYLEQFYNVPGICNEFDEKAILEEIFRAFKGVYDGEGRKKGTGKNGQTKTQGVNILPILLGQFLATGDDGSVLQRSLPVKFFSDLNRSAFQIQRFRELKALEKKGLTSVSCHLFRIRDYVDDGFVARFYESYERMKSELAAEGVVVKERILENYVNVYSITSIAGDKLEMAFSMNDFFNYCKEQIKTLSSIIKESNALAGFWKAVETMVDQEDIEQGYHYKVEVKPEIILASEERNKSHKKIFTEPKKLLYIRLSTIHSIYQKQHRNATGKSGLELENIKSYMYDQASFIGSNPSSSFKTSKGKTTITSSYIFDYDLLGVNLERGREEDEDNRQEVSINGLLNADAVIKDVFGTLILSFTLIQDLSYFQDGLKIEKIIYTNCTSRDTVLAPRLKKGKEIAVSGLLDEKVFGDTIRRRLEIKSMELITAEENGKAEEMSF